MNHKNDFEKLKKAWELFVQNGTVDTDIIRPEIADSWIRCDKANDLDYKAPLLTFEEIEKKRQENTHLIDLARPVMNEINDVMTDIADSYVIALFDVEGDIIDQVGKNNSIIQLGHRCSEMNGIVSPIGIALRTGQIAETVRYENLFPHAHDWHMAGSAIFNYDKSVAGFLCVINLNGIIPSMKSMVSLGTRVIEVSILREQITCYSYPVILNEITRMAMLVDENGTIRDVNSKFLNETGINSEDVLNKSLIDFISGRINEDQLVATDNASEEFKNIVLKNPVFKKTGISNYAFTLHKKIIRDDQNHPLILLIIENNSSDTVKHSGYRERMQLLSCVSFEQLIGESELFLQAKKAALRAAHTSLHVLIEGESGTGKDMIAQAIHKESGVKGPFVAVNCGAIPRDLLLSELFGYEDGAFTGAQKGGRPGKIEMADGGTLFLDEIGEMPLDMQVSLLRFLQDKALVRVGGSRVKNVDVRIIAATNRNMREAVKEGFFREDLYYRLNVIQIIMPPLRDRKFDLPLLVEHILSNIAYQLRSERKILSRDAIDIICKFNWPGNVRELKNVLERSFVFSDGKEIAPECLPSYLTLAETCDSVSLHSGSNLKTGNDLKSIEMATITETLKLNNFNVSRTAQDLGIARNTLYRKMVEFGITRQE